MLRNLDIIDEYRGITVKLKRYWDAVVGKTHRAALEQAWRNLCEIAAVEFASQINGGTVGQLQFTGLIFRSLRINLDDGQIVGEINKVLGISPCRVKIGDCLIQNWIVEAGQGVEDHLAR